MNRYGGEERSCLARWLFSMGEKSGVRRIYALGNTALMIVATTLPYGVIIEVNIMMFCTAVLLFLLAFVVLRFREPELPRPFKIGGGKLVATLCALLPTVLCGLNVVIQLADESRVDLKTGDDCPAEQVDGCLFKYFKLYSWLGVVFGGVLVDLMTAGLRPSQGRLIPTDSFGRPLSEANTEDQRVDRFGRPPSGGTSSPISKSRWGSSTAKNEPLLGDNRGLAREPW